MEKIMIFFSLGLLFLSQMCIVASKYPPCLSCDCIGNGCKKLGDKVQYEWPYNCIRIPDVCCNRVWLCPDEKGLVQVKPVVG
ncbi:unnamed protein product [Withania somnifera]